MVTKKCMRSGKVRSAGWRREMQYRAALIHTHFVWYRCINRFASAPGAILAFRHLQQIHPADRASIFIEYHRGAAGSL